ncbi:MAG TPA: hypothetical protein VGO96_13930 [Pyrinomonadaceae bacterium]|jgi:hypothetical protein|nr:hypothetical protein [Pyrinomonadaceae bacterium]
MINSLERETNAPLKRETPLRWRWGLLAALALMLISLIPQAHLCYKRGAEWHGSYAHFYSDEPAYSAYVNALIDGRPRLNDPYTGHDATGSAPQPESLFSIQFVPAYLISVPARAFGLTASTMFILLMPLVAGASALAIYWFVALLTRDERIAAAAVPLVLCLGILVSGQGVVVKFRGMTPAYVFLPFLRRYVPGVPIVFFFFYCGFVWLALTVAARRARLVSALVASVLFAAQVYSYFYHWTTAAALLGSLALLWLLARPADRRRSIEPFVLMSVCAVASLVPYFILLSRRAPTMDAVQALTYSHAPDLWRGVILLDALVLVALLFGAWRRWLDAREPAVVFNAALALSVLVVFNQQIITGRSLQPMHYEQYIGNYVALLAASLALGLLWQGRQTLKRTGDEKPGAERPAGAAASDVSRAEATDMSGAAATGVRGAATTGGRRLIPHRVWLPVALAALVWGAGETVFMTRRAAPGNLFKDEWAQVALRLKDLAREGSEPHPVVFNPSVYLIDNLPTYAPNATVWAPHTFVFSNVSVEENKERFYKFLYYSGVGANDFETVYRQQGYIFFAIFGWHRANPRLTVNYQPITQAEIDAEKNNYAAFHSSFDRRSAAQPTISYVVTQTDQPFNFAPLERWYTRDAGEKLGRHIIYRVKLRD